MIARITQLGTQHTASRQLARRVIIGNVISLLTVPVLAIFAVIFFFIGDVRLSWISCGFMMGYIFFPLLNHVGFHLVSRFLNSLYSNAVILISFLILGEDSGVKWMLFILVTIPFILFELKERWVLVAALVFPAINWYVMTHFDLSFPIQVQFYGKTLLLINGAFAFSSFGIMAMCLYVFVKSGVDLEAKLNQTIQDLQQKENELLVQNEELLQTTEELLATQNTLADNQKKLVNSKEEAEHALQVKSDFLSNMSHEIRTPMNVIIGLTNILLEGQVRDENRENLKLVKNSADNLLVIINDILDFQKLEDGQVEIIPVNINLKELQAEVMGTFAPRAKSKNLELMVEIDENCSEAVYLDKVRLVQILINLLDNALKFTSEGWVKLHCSFEGDKNDLYFKVSDSGIGIHPSRQTAIFESFSQASGKISRKYGGTGLGLAICKKLVERMGGRIGLDSKPDVGTTITVCLPQGHAVSNLPESHIEEKIDFTGVQVLVAEDFEMNQLFISQVLNKWNVKFDIANDGSEALNFCSQRKYDLILMDLQMPIMTGFDATTEIRKIANLSPNVNTPIIAVSADVFPETRLRASGCGMNGFITKPIKKDDLAIKMRELLAD